MSSDIHMRAISQKVPQPSINEISLKITLLILYSNHPGNQWVKHVLAILPQLWPCVSLQLSIDVCVFDPGLIGLFSRQFRITIAWNKLKILTTAKKHHRDNSIINTYNWNVVCQSKVLCFTRWLHRAVCDAIFLCWELGELCRQRAKYKAILVRKKACRCFYIVRCR